MDEYQRDILTGTLLGDGNLELSQNGKSARLKIERSTKDKDFSLWEYELFKEFLCKWNKRIFTF